MTIKTTIARACLAVLCVFGLVAPTFAGPAVAAGSSHVVALSGSGVVWTWGSNSSGQLGDGTQISRVTPESLAIAGVTAVAAGSTSSYALKSDGTVWAWGSNASGQLGDGTTTFRPSPVAVSGLLSITAISAGGSHAMALKSDGTLWTWGANTSGQIGDNTTTTRTTPVQVTSLGTSVQAIGAAKDHSHATKTDGTVWSWGSNQFSEAGDGTTTTPRMAPVQTGTLSTMTGVAGGGYFGFAWTSSGALSAWGYNAFGSLGDGTISNRASPVSIAGMSTVVSLASGSGMHAVAVKADGSAWAWGYNAQGQVGDDTMTTQTAPVQLTTLDSVVSVAAGTYFSVAVSSDGRVWTWGDNYYGELGDGTTTQRNAPVQISDAGFAWRVATPTFSPDGGSFTANVTVTVASATAGVTIHYTTNGLDPVDTDPTITSGGTLSITQTTTVKARASMAGMAASSIHSATYTLTVVNPSFSPGAGTYGTAQTVTISTSTAGATIRYTIDGTTPTASSPVYTSGIAVTTGTTLKAIGLMTGWTTSGVASAGYLFNYGTLATPTISPTPGQVGYGTQVTLSAAPLATVRYTTDGSTPTAASPLYTAPITVTATVPLNARAFQQDWTTSATSGGTFTVKVGTPGFSPSAGTYAPGQLVTITNGTPNAVIRYTTNGVDPTATDPLIVSGGTVVAGNYTLKARGFISGWTSSDVASAAYSLTGAFTNWAVAAGQSHSVGLKNDGTVWTWGSNASDQLGDTTTGRSTAAMVNGVTGAVGISAGASHNLALRADGTVWAWGDNSYGQLGDNSITSRSTPAPVTGLSSVTAIAAGTTFSVARKSDGTVWAWGDNGYGQLGDGTQVQRLLPTQVPNGTGVVAIAAGNDHAVARKSDGSIWSWGSNGYGQLGSGAGNVFMSTTPVQMPGLVATAGPWAGLGYTLIVMSDGTAWGWGFNSFGQLGVGTTSGSSAPLHVSTLSNVVMAAGSSGYFSMAVQSDGSAWAWGSNGHGQLGDGTTSSHLAPYHMGGITNAAGFAAGVSHAVIVTSDGSVWASGYNGTGQLGDGTLDDRWVPVQISEPGFNWKTSTPRLAPSTGTYAANTSVTVSAVTPAAEIHYTTNGIDPTQTDSTVSSGATVVITQSVTLKARAWATGMPVSNVAAAVYTMTLTAPTLTPVAGTYLATQTVTMGADSGTTVRYTTDGTDPTAASAAYAGAITIDATTTVNARAFKTGWTTSAMVANSYTLKVVPPAFTPAGGSYGAGLTVAIATTTPSATIRYTLNGAEPTVTSTVYSSPLSVSSTATVKAVASRTGWLDSDSGAVTFWITQGTAATPTFLPAAGSYSAPVFVAMASATSGALVRYTVDGSDPTSASMLYQCPIRITATTTIKARAYAQAFTPSAVGSAVYVLDAAGAVDTPVMAPAGGMFATGRTAAVTVLASGATVRYTTTGVDPVATDAVVPVGGIAVDRSMIVKVKAWSASATPSAVRRADFVVTGAVAASNLSSHALKADGTVWSWGNNPYGQLGDGSYTPRTAPVAAQGLTNVVALASATDHTLAVKADGTVWSWGGNSSDQLGDTSGGHTVPTQVPGLTQIVAVAAGYTHSVALRGDGTVWTWGGNATGQLGDGTTTTRATPTMIAGLSGVNRIAAGQDFTLAVENDGLSAGRVWAWGNNAAGQLGDGSRVRRLTPVQANVTGRVTAIAAGWAFAMAVTDDGAVWTWGSNANGQLGDGTLIDSLAPLRVPSFTGAFAVAAGGTHAAAITTDGRMWTWGTDRPSWLGAGDAEADPVAGVTGALAIAAGYLYTLAVQPDGTVIAWGDNSFGQLGDGSLTGEATPVSTSGLSLANNAWLMGDQDADLLPTWREYLVGTDPLNWDTGGSGVGDYVLVTSGFHAASCDPFGLNPVSPPPLPYDPLDHTAPVITLIAPTGARRIS